MVYHNNQRLGHHKVSVHHSDVFACYERNNFNTPFQADRVGHDAAMERVAQPSAPEPSEAVEPPASGSSLLTPSAMTAMWILKHLSKQGILSSLSAEPVVNAAKVKLLKPRI